jgi:single-strand DNA-binding protein
MNTVECAFTGRLGSDPELRTSRTGKPWCRVSVAVGLGDDTQWLSVSAFGETAERVCEDLAKGDRCYCEGNLRLAEWQDREGLTRHGLQVAAWRVEALGKIGRQRPRQRKPDAPSEGSSAPAAPVCASQDWQRPLGDDAIPF